MIANLSSDSGFSATSAFETSWSLIDAAANVDLEARERFARRYLDPVRDFLSARWRGSSLIRYLDDAVQEVFLECFGDEGPLQSADRSRDRGFRPYLYGIARNVARRFEHRASVGQSRLGDTALTYNQLPADESSLSVVFDRSWARCIIQQAVERQCRDALKKSGTALRRVELLRLRFQEGLPIREIAARWNVDAKTLHHEYAKARQEFKAALVQIVASYHPGASVNIERECKELAALLR